MPAIHRCGSRLATAFADGDRLTRIVTAGGFRDVAIQALTKPIRVGGDVDDVIAFITSLPESQQFLAGKPADKVTATGLAPYAGTDGVVMNDTAWLASAYH
jgi:hypothetical protein